MRSVTILLAFATLRQFRRTLWAVTSVLLMAATCAGQSVLELSPPRETAQSLNPPKTQFSPLNPPALKGLTVPPRRRVETAIPARDSEGLSQTLKFAPKAQSATAAPAVDAVIETVRSQIEFQDLQPPRRTTALPTPPTRLVVSGSNSAGTGKAAGSDANNEPHPPIRVAQP